MTAITEKIENGTFDGFLWTARFKDNRVPEYITTKSGNVYSVKEMFDYLHPHTHFLNWAPQTAVFMHPSVSDFLIHGGAGSFYKGL